MTKPNYGIICIGYGYIANLIITPSIIEEWVGIALNIYVHISARL
ncbi:hypothetical protein [Candidatus Tisiphia endosymbiont of Oplodontha viridula]